MDAIGWHRFYVQSKSPATLLHFSLREGSIIETLWRDLHWWFWMKFFSVFITLLPDTWTVAGPCYMY